MADTASAPAAADDERVPIQQQTIDDVEMQNLTKNDNGPAHPNTTASELPTDGDKSVSEAHKDTAAVDSSLSPRTDALQTEELTIDPVEEGQSPDGELNINIMLQLTNGARHPFRIDEKYLTKRNVNVTAKTDDGKMDLASITVYTLKELILRDWRREWEEPPREPTSIRLIHFGKLLDDRNQLSHYHFKTTGINWVHLTVKPQDLIDEEEASKKVNKTSSHRTGSSCCVIL
ncbi:hypothetical protein F5Y16DRAFT_386918 [Xylariaceae sp. FL0255]|nr:hypothetical protein F5Y16DRAFT_386918 [Xylariaceae sp. FL0255]